MVIPQGLFLCHSFGAGAEFNPFAAPLHGRCEHAIQTKRPMQTPRMP
nr:MAG TPA: hypothetical protein [Caudoviricetes sp.]